MPCPRCSGTGRMREPGFDGPTMVACPNCHGTGVCTITLSRAMWALIALDLTHASPGLASGILAALETSTAPERVGMRVANEATRNELNNAFIRVDARLRLGEGKAA